MRLSAIRMHVYSKEQRGRLISHVSAKYVLIGKRVSDETYNGRLCQWRQEDGYG